MIRSFADKATKAVFEGWRVKQLPHEIQAKARRQLKFIDATSKIEELRIPLGNRLELLSGNRTGQWSIRINDQWRICFRWNDGHAEDVEIVDYH